MTYQQIKDTVVKEEKLLDVKGLRKFMIKWALFVFGFSLSLLLLVFSLMGSRFALLVPLIAAFLFTQVLTLIVEEPNTFNKINKIVRFWWISYIVVVAVFLVLKFFNFM